MEFYRIWRILVDNKHLVIWLPLIALIVGLAATYVLPEQYESTALVLARPVEEIKFASGAGEKKEIRDFPVNLSAPIDAPSKTYMEVIKSPAVAVKIVEALRLDVKPVKTDQTWLEQLKDNVKTWLKATMRTTRNYFKYGRDIPATPFELALEDLDNLAVAVRKDTYAFDITYRSSNPQEAADVANMAAEIFLENSSDAYKRESGRTRLFFEDQLKDSRKALEAARLAIQSYKNNGGTFELASEYSEKLKIVSDLENTLAKVKGRLAGRKALVENKYSPTLISNEAEIAELNAQIAKVRAQLAVYPKKETQINGLIMQERLAQQSYEFFLKRYEEAHVKEQSNAPEIRIVSRASPGLYPVKPLKYVYAGLSFLTALVLAIGWALLVDAINPRIRTVADLEGDLSIPVLGEINAFRATPI